MATFGFGPSLALVPVRGRPAGLPARAGFDFTRAALPPGATLLRSSVAGWRDAGGGWQTAGVDQPRFAFDPVNGACRGVILERGATNLLAQGDAIDAAEWARAGVTTSAPGGLIEATGLGTHQVRSGPVPFVAGASYCLSVEVAERPGSGKRRPCLALGAAGTAGAFGSTSLWVKFDAATGAVFVNGGGAASPVACGAEPLGGGGWRFWIKAAALRTVEDRVDLRLTNAAGNGMSYSGDGSSGLVFRRAQLEQLGSASVGPSSWIATGAAAANRAADMMTLDWSRLGVPDGQPTIRYTLDDRTVFEAATAITGGRAAVGELPGMILTRAAIA